MFCTSCGTQMPDGTKFCMRCGVPMSAPMPERAMPSDPPSPPSPQPASGAEPRPTARGGSYAARFINEPSPVPHRASATPPPPPPPPQARPTYAAPRPTSYPLPPAEGNMTRRLVLAGICLVLAFLSLPSSALMSATAMGIVPGGSSFFGSPVPEIPLMAFFTIFVTLGMPFFLICLILQSCMRSRERLTLGQNWSISAPPYSSDCGCSFSSSFVSAWTMTCLITSAGKTIGRCFCRFARGVSFSLSPPRSRLERR